jgi:hypothetical protein
MVRPFRPEASSRKNELVPRADNPHGGDCPTGSQRDPWIRLYQLYATAAAWLNLKEDERLLVEVAEDYATLAAGILQARQVRDNPSANTTLRSLGVSDTLNAFWALRQSNPGLMVRSAADEEQVRASRLVVSTPTSPFPTDEVAPLGLAIYGNGPRGDGVIGGYAPGSIFATVQALSRAAWVLSPSQIDGAAITPPPHFSGAMDLVFELRLADARVVDRKHARLEWSAPPAEASANVAQDAPPALSASAAGPAPTADTPGRTLSSEQLVALLKRGNELVSHGDLIGARLILERASQAGESRAALALASTYDPLVLEHLGERGLRNGAFLVRTSQGTWLQGSPRASRGASVVQIRRQDAPA